jgi:hypothetical protein
MNKRSFLLTLAAGLLACSLATVEARAGTILVNEAEGTFNFVLTANGAGQYTISYTVALLTGINSTPLSTGPIVSTFANKTVDITSTTTSGPFTSYTLSETPASKSYGTGAGSIQTATLTNTVSTAYAVSGFLNVSGTVTGVPSALLETSATSPTIYDFSLFANGGSIALTYNKVGTDFAAVLKNGGTITGTGGFTETAAPEPASIALLGIGMTGLLALRRVLKRSFRA